ncbi:MAG: amino acid aminotransferase [Pseudomonadota bacterium]
MLTRLTPPQPDRIMAMVAAYKADDRPGKVDLGVGVYKDAEGRTPVMGAVKSAEARLLESQDTKAYVGLLGDLDFVGRMRDVVLGDAVPADRVIGAQAPGGTGAIRLILELIRLAKPDATIWYSDPTWPNHPAMVAHVGLNARTYRYFDAATCEVDAAAMLEDLSQVQPDDVVILHGCCHNPTGANPTPETWAALTDMLVEKGAIPFIDFAYQGFGDGLAEDATAVRAMAARVPQMFVAASCSKNFGLYRDRVGVAMTLIGEGSAPEAVRGAMSMLGRLNHSFPPDHGAKTVEIILADDALRASWEAELEAMRTRMLGLRAELADCLKRETNSDRFEFFRHHRGMFSRLGLTPEAVEALRRERGIYLVADSRLNVAGLPAGGIGDLARAIAAVA